MPKIIAVAGKGGTGKTTICGMLVRNLAARSKGHILAVDADPNSNLNEVLGVAMPVTIGEIREGMLARGEGDNIPAGMTKQDYMAHMFIDALHEDKSFDLLVMGRTQGAGCYCYINGVLRAQIDKHAGGYSHIVVDNEAGLEHISRGTLPRVDTLLLVSDCSRRGIQAAGRAAQMANDLSLKPKVLKLIVNRAPDGKPDDGIMEEIKNQGLDLLGVLPHDETVYRFDSEGKPSADVPDDSAIKSTLRDIINKLEL